MLLLLQLPDKEEGIEEREVTSASFATFDKRIEKGAHLVFPVFEEVSLFSLYDDKKVEFAISLPSRFFSHILPNSSSYHRIGIKGVLL